MFSNARLSGETGTFPAQLLRLRETRGITQRAAAEAIGVTPAYLCRVEKGDDAIPYPRHLVALAKLYEQDPVGLLWDAGYDPRAYATSASSPRAFDPRVTRSAQILDAQGYQVWVLSGLCALSADILAISPVDPPRLILVSDAKPMDRETRALRRDRDVLERDREVWEGIEQVNRWWIRTLSSDEQVWEDALLLGALQSLDIDPSEAETWPESAKLCISRLAKKLAKNRGQTATIPVDARETS